MMDWIPDLRQLRAFVAVADEGSFTMAAKRLFVTQSAVSHAMRTLEEQLSCKLLDRSGKRVIPTPEGELVLERCRRALGEISQAGRDVDNLRRWGQTRIRIGAAHSLCHFLLPSVMREFRDAFPRCELVLEAGDTTRMVDRLAGAELDVVLGLLPRQGEEPGSRFLHREEMVFVVSPHHPWAKLPEVAADSMSDATFLIYSKGSETHRLTREWLDAEVGRSRNCVEMGDMQAIREMAKLGMGVGILAPWVASREIEEGSLVMFPIPGAGIRREWAAFHGTKKPPSLVEEAFIGLCAMAFEAI